MNKLLFSEGGQPLYLDDLNFMQSAFADSIKGIVSPFGDVVLSGCSIESDENKTSWTEGYIVISGEIYKVDSGSINNPIPTDLYWKVVRTNEQLETFENKSENHIYQIGKAVLVESVSKQDIYADAKTVRNIDSYLMTYKKKEIEFVPQHAGTSGSITLYENSQGFHIIKMNFNVTSKISFTLQPIFAYRSNDRTDYKKISGRYVVHVQGVPFIVPLLVTDVGAVYLYNSSNEASFTLEAGFNFSITYIKTPL